MAGADDTKPHFPREILIEIFSRLPTRSIGKCRCLSKSWRTDLSTTKFIKLHSTRKPHEENLLLVSRTGTLHTVAPPFSSAVVSKELVELGETWRGVLGSCNGLVLVENADSKMFVVNPVTREKVYIPPCPTPLFKKYGGKGVMNSGNQMLAVGFGYDCANDDYKVVRLVCYFDVKVRGSNFEFVEVYSLKLGVWRSVDVAPSTNISSIRRAEDKSSYICGACVGGAIYWLSRPELVASFSSTIVAFDLGEEVFREIPDPTGASNTCMFSRMFVCGGRLAVVGIDMRKWMYFLVWVMEKDEPVASWTTYFVAANTMEYGDITPLYFMGGKEIVLMFEKDRRLAVYDLEEETTEEMAVDGREQYFDAGTTFVQSLVSPNKHQDW